LNKLILGIGKKNRIDAKTVFFTLVVINFIIFCISIFITDGAAFAKLFYVRQSDSFMDFFNSILFTLSKNVSAYKDSGVIYPPLAYLIFGLFGHLIPGANYMDAFQLRESQMGQISLLLFTVVCISVMFYLLYRYFNGKEHEKLIFLSVLLFSAPLLYLIERGNILLLVLVLITAYITLMDSKNAVLREISLICLALAAGIKIYPAILGLMLIFSKKYSAAVRCLLYGIVFFIVPFFFFGGFNTITVFIHNITDETSSVPFAFDWLFSRADLASMLAVPYYMFRGTLDGCEHFARILSFIITGQLLLGSFLFKEKWLKLLCLTIIMVILPPFNYTYILVFYFLPLTLFLSKKESSSFDPFYVILFIMIIAPIAFGNIYSLGYFSLSQLSSMIAQLVLILMLFIRVLKYEYVWVVSSFEKRKPKPLQQPNT